MSIRLGPATLTSKDGKSVLVSHGGLEVLYEGVK